MTANDLLAFGVIEHVFSEHNGEFEKVCGDVRQALREELQTLCALAPEQLCQLRYDKFRRIGGDAR